MEEELSPRSIRLPIVFSITNLLTPMVIAVDTHPSTNIIVNLRDRWPSGSKRYMSRQLHMGIDHLPDRLDCGSGVTRIEKSVNEGYESPFPLVQTSATLQTSFMVLRDPGPSREDLTEVATNHDDSVI